MDALPINMTDLAIALVLGLSAAFAFFRGFVHELLAIGSWVGAAVATLYGFPLAQPKARELIASPLLADMAAGIAIFLIVLIALSIVTRLLSRRVRDSSLGPLDRSLGLVFGALRGAVLVCIAWLVLLWAIPREDHPDWIAEAKALPLLEQGGAWLAELIPDELGGRAARAAGVERPDKIAEERYQLLLSPGAKSAQVGEKPGYKGVERDAMKQLIEAATQDDAAAGEVGR